MGFDISDTLISHAPRGGTEVNINLEHQPSKLLATLIITAYPNSPVMDLPAPTQQW